MIPISILVMVIIPTPWTSRLLIITSSGKWLTTPIAFLCDDKVCSIRQSFIRNDAGPIDVPRKESEPEAGHQAKAAQDCHFFTMNDGIHVDVFFRFTY